MSTQNRVGGALNFNIFSLSWKNRNYGVLAKCLDTVTAYSDRVEKVYYGLRKGPHGRKSTPVLENIAILR